MDGVYWDESHCYRFTADEIDELEAASRDLHQISLAAVEHIVTTDRFEQLAIAPGFADRIRASWKARDPAVAGRFDLAYDGSDPPKLLEYNADTPTALLEASVVQWAWLQEVRPGDDQFNSIHEKLIARWEAIRARLPADGRIYFAGDSASAEDQGNLDYLRDTAMQAGLEAIAIDVADIGWDGARFVDLDGRTVGALFKLYPWEWMVREEFGEHLLKRAMTVIEPAWKMLLSNKAILPVLWEMFPDHPNLLPASFEPGRFATDYVKKPLYSREGANVSINARGSTVEVPGEYGEEGFIWQAYHELPRFGPNYCVIGSWIVGGEPAGISIREDATPVTRNTSRFVPHYFT